MDWDCLVVLLGPPIALIVFLARKDWRGLRWLHRILQQGGLVECVAATLLLGAGVLGWFWFALESCR